MANEDPHEAGDYSNLSCADLAILDEQGLSINHAVASAAATLLMKMLVLGDLQYHCVHVSLDAGTQFVYNSPRILRRHLKTAREIKSLSNLEDDDGS